MAEVAAGHEDADEADPRDDEPELMAPFFVQSVFFLSRFFLTRKHLMTDPVFFQFRSFLVQLQLNFFFFLLSFLVVQKIKIA